jgi:murein DD-endopeptidase MepM/ murein hydrolase activator NlpD
LRRPLDLAGNHVILKHGPREYSAYMHLMPGLKVRPGQRVEQGQVVGLCGNSGNSLETHLHFQLQDGPDPIRARGLPVRFGDFTVHWAHVSLYVPPDRPMPLPVRLTVEPGRAEGAVLYDPR